MPKTQKSVVQAVKTFKVDEGTRLRICCRRGKCKGSLELSPDEIVNHQPPPIFCPECKGELSSGMRTSVPADDKLRVLATLFSGLVARTYCPTFSIELVKGPKAKE